MRKLVWLAVIGGLAWWFLGRREAEPEETVTIGYADGSAVTLEAGAPEFDRLLQIAAGATAG